MTNENNEIKWFGSGLVLMLVSIAVTPVLTRTGLDDSWIVAATPIYLAMLNLLLAGTHVATQLFITSLPFFLVYTFTMLQIDRDWLLWAEALLMFLSSLLFIPFWGSSAKAFGIEFTVSLFLFHTLCIAIFLYFVFLSIKRKNSGLRYAANIVFFCMFILCLFPVGLYLDGVEDLYDLRLRRDDTSGEIEHRANAARIGNELDFIQYAQDALSWNETEAAFRLLEGFLISEYKEVREGANQLIIQEPIINQGTLHSFRP